MNLADNLKKIRKEHNLSQEQLADELGVSRQSVSKWESNQAYPEMDKVLQICKIFNLNIDELLNQDIKEVNEQKQTKNNINKYIDDFLEFITKFIDMFSSMKFKQKVKFILEQLFIMSMILLVLLIIGVIGSWLIIDIFSFLPNDVYHIIYTIIKDIYIISGLILSFLLILYIFKTRYLDYYVFIEKDEECRMENVKKELILDKKEKIIIRDPEHSGYKFIAALLKFLLIVIKCFATFIAIVFCFSLVGFIFCFVVSFMFVKTGLIFLGTLLILLSCIAINLLILETIYNFIVSKKTKKRLLFISFIVALLIFGSGCGLFFIGFTNFNIKTDYNTKEEKVITMRDDLVITDSFMGQINYFESDNSDIKIIIEHSKYYDVHIVEYNIDNQNKYVINFDIISNYEIMDITRKQISDINNKEYINYNNYKINIYTTKENIEKLKNNYINCPYC